MEKHMFRAHELPLRYEEAEVTKVKAKTELIAAETAAKLADRPAVPQAAPVTTAPQEPRQRDSDRRNKIPRPEVDKGINLSDWNFFQSQWSRYVVGTGLAGPSVVLHMWEACTEPLQRSLHHAGAGGETDPEALMSLI